jgi:hypothetical protein
MSDTSNDTAAIDEKKGIIDSSSPDSYVSKVASFLKSIIIVIVVILFYFSGGAIMLFLCKLAQSNILPTELNCAPYTDTQPVINPSPIQTNIFTTFSEPEMSMKLQIPYDINSKYKLIDMFKEYKESPSSSFLGNYFISIIESLFQFNYSSINSTMNLMNTTFSEGLIIGLGPIISGFIYAFKIIFNIFYFIYLWFSSMSWFFKTNKNDSGDGKPQWEDVSITSPLNWSLGIVLAILFTFIFPMFILLPITCYHYVLFSTLFYKSFLNGKQISPFAIVIETLKYYKVTIVSIISLCVILLAFSKLGTTAGVCSLVTLCLVYYGVISIDIFKSIPEKNLTPSVSYEQAKKTCSTKIPTSEKHGFLYNLLLGQKGGNITKELKKIGRNLA